MKKSITKKLVSITICLSVLIGVAMISNAVTIGNGGYNEHLPANRASGSHGYSYSVSYIHYSGMPEGAHMYSGLTGRAIYQDNNSSENVTVCTINSNGASGNYYLNCSGVHIFRVYNNTGKQVTINYSFSY